MPLKTLMVAVGVAAFCFGLFGVVYGGILSTILLLTVANAHRFRLRVIEGSAVLVWLLFVVVVSSNPSQDVMVYVIGVVPFGVIVLMSWLLRQTVERACVKPESTLTSDLLVPGAIGLALVLSVTNVGIQGRIALSESALRADANTRLQGLQGGRLAGQRNVGLFSVSSVQDLNGCVLNGCVLWSTGSSGMYVVDGIACVPIGFTPKLEGCEFVRMYGEWWIFSARMDYVGRHGCGWR